MEEEKAIPCLNNADMDCQKKKEEAREKIKELAFSLVFHPEVHTQLALPEALMDIYPDEVDEAFEGNQLGTFMELSKFLTTEVYTDSVLGLSMTLADWTDYIDIYNLKETYKAEARKLPN